MRLSDLEPQKVTKTVHITMLGGGMVTCGMVTCGGALCVYTFEIWTYSIIDGNFVGIWPFSIKFVKM